MENAGGEGVAGADAIDDIWNGDRFRLVSGRWHIDARAEPVLVGMVD